MALKDINWQVDWLQFRVDFDSSRDPFKYCKSLVESLGYSIEQRQRSLRFYDTSFSVVSSFLGFLTRLKSVQIIVKS